MLHDIELVSRVAVALVFYGTMAIGITHRRRATVAGGRVPRSLDPLWSRLPMPFIALPLLLLLIVYPFRSGWPAFSTIDLPGWLRLVGIPLGLLALAIIQWMFRHLGLNVTATSQPRTTATLVTSGPYRWVRHPMYSTIVVLLLAYSLLTTSWLVASLGAAAFILIACRTVIEERRLVEKFGQAYRDYQHTTGRFLPVFPPRAVNSLRPNGR